MASLTTSPRRVKPSRHATLGNPVNGHYPLLITVAKGAKVEKSGYYVEALPCDLGGRAFRVHKLPHEVEEGQDPAYDVQLDGANSSCTCLGHLRWGHKTVCRHVACLQALVSRNRL
jgi:hypothetical protein